MLYIIIVYNCNWKGLSATQRDTAEWRKLICDTQVNLYFVDVEPDSRVHAATNQFSYIVFPKLDFNEEC